MCAESLQSCPILCNPMDHSPPQAPLSLGFSRQESWSGLPRPPPGDLPDRRIEPTSPAASALQTDSLPLSHGVGPTWGQINGNKWVIRRQVGALRQRGHLQPFQSVIILKYEEEGPGPVCCVAWEIWCSTGLVGQVGSDPRVAGCRG